MPIAALSFIYEPLSLLHGSAYTSLLGRLAPLEGLIIFFLFFLASDSCSLQGIVQIRHQPNTGLLVDYSSNMTLLGLSGDSMNHGVPPEMCFP